MLVLFFTLAFLPRLCRLVLFDQFFSHTYEMDVWFFCLFFGRSYVIFWKICSKNQFKCFNTSIKQTVSALTEMCMEIKKPNPPQATTTTTETKPCKTKRTREWSLFWLSVDRFLALRINGRYAGKQRQTDNKPWWNQITSMHETFSSLSLLIWDPIFGKVLFFTHTHDMRQHKTKMK